MTARLEVLASVSEHIWAQKYRLRAGDGTPVDASIEDTWRRVAQAVAQAEPENERRRWAAQFYEAMAGFGFIPAGRILAGAGTERNVTLFNCFVMGRIGDDMASIFENVKEAALTMQQGGGIGHDFSTLRPKGARVAGVGAEASGPVSFMDVWDAMCRTIMSAGARRGAMMATLACDHPDIEAFIEAKADPARLRMFNLSVLITDAFMQAVKDGADWSLVFNGEVYRTVAARDLWDRIMRAAYDYAEPGVIFIDRVNKANTLNYCETIRASNPCGEQMLPPYGACLLGSINLARLIKNPFEATAALDEARLDELLPLAVRFLDNVIDVSRFPLAAQEREARAKRRIGLGITGLADALIMCRKHYGSAEAVALAGGWMARIERLAYLASSALAAEKGAFPLFDAKQYLAAGKAPLLPGDVRDAIERQGLRNGLVTSIAPTGAISLLAGNVSSGIEPVFDFTYRRRILQGNGAAREETVEDYAFKLFRQKFGSQIRLPDYFTAAHALQPAQHLKMQAALQPHVGSSISKTVNCPQDLPFEGFKDIYVQAYALGLKGCTAYRPNSITGAVLSSEPAAAPAEEQQALPLAAPPQLAETGAAGMVMPRPMQRDSVLPGFTYKLKWPDSDHAIYVTINDIIQDGRRRPFEIFINSKNLEHYAWTVALTRMISAVFRRGGDISFVAGELKAVFDPRGGQWMGGRYVPSLLAAIGGVIEEHLINTGAARPPSAREGATAKILPPALHRLKICPRCGSPSVIFQEGCYVCRDCGYSKCS